MQFLFALQTLLHQNGDKFLGFSTGGYFLIQRLLSRELPFAVNFSLMKRDFLRFGVLRT